MISPTITFDEFVAMPALTADAQACRRSGANDIFGLRQAEWPQNYG